MFLRAIRISDTAPRQEFPFTIPALKNLERLEFGSPITFLIGENGSGKSTILEFTPDGIHPVAYADTEQLRITRDFLNAPERTLKHLFED
jgi:predicted ATPase